MVSKLLIIKDYNKRIFLNKNFMSKIYLKSNIQNFYLKKKIYYYLVRFISLYDSYSKIKNFCVLSYRRRGVFNYFKLTRMMFKFYALNKQLVGIIKSSW
jgi:ribosomal protein S14